MATITIEPVRHKNVHGKESLYLRLRTVHADYLMQVGKGSIEWVEEQQKLPEEGERAENGPELPFKEMSEGLKKDLEEATGVPLKEAMLYGNQIQERAAGITDKRWKQYVKAMDKASIQIGYDEWSKNNPE